MAEEVVVSVIIAVYNVEAYLENCLKSLCNQTYSSLEIILIDDGSTDASAALCDYWAKKDFRVKVIHQKNAGVSAARNKGLEIASGVYVTFVDSDDWVEPDFIEELVKNHHQGEMTVTGYQVDFVQKKQNKSVLKTYSGDEICYLEKIETVDLFGAGLFSSIWNKLYERERLQKQNIQFPEEMNLGEDIVFNLHYMKDLPGKICMVNKALYHYMRRGESSLDHRYHEKFVEMQKAIYSEFIALIEGMSDNTQAKKKLICLYFNALVASMDNIYLSRNSLERSFYRQKMKERREEGELRTLLNQMEGKTKWIYTIRYFMLSHGFYVFDYHLRKTVKRILGLE